MHLMELVRYIFSQSTNLLLPFRQYQDGPWVDAKGLRKQDLLEASALYFSEYSSETEKEFISLKGSTFVENLVDVGLRHVVKMQEMGGSILLPSLPWFPDLLRHLPDAPIGLNVLGDFSILSDSANVAVVGSRKACRKSMDVAFELGRSLAESDSVVVSGGAYGCDISAHRGALSSKSPHLAVAVMAGGLEELYPKGNEKTFRQILLKGGCILSERLCFDKPRPYYFLIRNRIIAGLCQSVCVIQAAERSGALYTASRALDYGRDVFASEVFSDSDGRFRGNQTLLKDGAMSFERFYESMTIPILSNENHGIHTGLSAH